MRRQVSPSSDPFTRFPVPTSALHLLSISTITSELPRARTSIHITSESRVSPYRRAIRYNRPGALAVDFRFRFILIQPPLSHCYIHIQIIAKPRAFINIK